MTEPIKRPGIDKAIQRPLVKATRPRKPRKALERSLTPIARSKTPLKRSGAIKRISKKGIARRKAWQDAKANFLKVYSICQWCGGLADNNMVTHHKLKRSLGGKENLENLVVLHAQCHNDVHLHVAFYFAVKDSLANVINGKIV